MENIQLNSFIDFCQDMYIATESYSGKFNSIEEFSEWMKHTIKYKDFTTLMNPEDVYKQKCGSCHDQVMFESKVFQDNKWNYGLRFFIEYNPGKSEGGCTHSLLYFTRDSGIYWFENAWGGEEGIHGPYKNMESLEEDVKSKLLKDSNYKQVLVSPVKNIHPGMDLGSFVNAILQ